MGTKEGGIHTRNTIKQRYGADYYQRIGTMGGNAKKTRPFGFQTMTPSQRSAAGRKGVASRLKRRTDNAVFEATIA